MMGWRPGRAWLLLAAGMALWAVADTVSLYQTAAGSYVAGTWLDLCWPAALVLVATASCQPVRRVQRATFVGWPTLAVPAGFGVAALALAVFDHFSRIHTAALLLAGGTIALVIARLALTFTEYMRALSLQPGGGGERPADRPAEPPRAHAAARGGARAGRRALRGDPVRPRRLQVVQRHVRPPGRRRAARTDRARALRGPTTAAPSTAWAATSSACLRRSRAAMRKRSRAAAARCARRARRGSSRSRRPTASSSCPTRRRA